MFSRVWSAIAAVDREYARSRGQYTYNMLPSSTFFYLRSKPTGKVAHRNKDKVFFSSRVLASQSSNSRKAEGDNELCD